MSVHHMSARELLPKTQESGSRMQNRLGRVTHDSREEQGHWHMEQDPALLHIQTQSSIP